MNACRGTTASRRFALRTIVMVAIFAMVGTLSVSWFARADVLTVIGHTGNPTGQHPDVAKAVGGSLIGDRTVKYVWTYEQFWPATGTMRLDESIDASIPLVIDAIKNETDPNNRIIGESQGAADVGGAYNYFVAHPDKLPPGTNPSFVFLASPVTPNGGILARFPGVSIPYFGISYRQPTMNSQYQVVDSHWAYDMFSSSPMYLDNPLSWLNAFLGVYRSDAMSLHGIDADYTNPNYDVHTTVVGNTTYHVIVPEHLPMYQPLVDHGYGALVAVIEPLTKVWVNAGYYKNDPTADPGTYHPAQLFMPIGNIIRALLQTPGALAQGLAAIPNAIGSVLNPKPKSATTTPPVTTQNQEQSSGQSPTVSPAGAVATAEKSVVHRQAKPVSAETVKSEDAPTVAKRPVRTPVSPVHDSVENSATSPDPVSTPTANGRDEAGSDSSKTPEVKRPKSDTVKATKPVRKAPKSGPSSKPVTGNSGRGASVTKSGVGDRHSATKPARRAAHGGSGHRSSGD